MPHQTAEFDLGFVRPDHCRCGCHLNLSLCTRYDTMWAKRGHEVAAIQMTIPTDHSSGRICVRKECPVTYTEDAEHIYVEGADFLYTFYRLYGGFESVQKNGVEMLAGCTRTGIWRALADGDRNIKHTWTMTADSTWNMSENYDKAQTKVYSAEVKSIGADKVIISVRQSICPISKMPLVRSEITYTIEGDGEIIVKSRSKVREDATWLPRFGFEFEMPADNE